ncbi:hypothetical protein ACFU44_13890 [Nocardia rhizosphaerihabitans]|uniref:hypothetical protein n=1 Tax=Nocardia rhizosphaerihabitans TaxID=1691570 RepID=UPI00366C19F1
MEVLGEDYRGSIAQLVVKDRTFGVLNVYVPHQHSQSAASGSDKKAKAAIWGRQGRQVG